MSATDYRQALDAACREYETLAAQRADIEQRLDRLHETIGALTRLCGLTPTVPWGLTDACRVVLRRSDAPLTPLAVRDRLRQVGFDFSRYSNELAAIHTTLKRLAEAGELRRVKQARGERAYSFLRVRVMTLDQVRALTPAELGFDARPLKGRS